MDKVLVLDLYVIGAYNPQNGVPDTSSYGGSEIQT